MPGVVKCPHCCRAVEFGPQSPFRPFCSERCKLADLGAWASDGYRISGRLTDSADDTAIPPDPRTSPGA
jgi:hypothetical protein